MRKTLKVSELAFSSRERACTEMQQNELNPAPDPAPWSSGYGALAAGTNATLTRLTRAQAPAFYTTADTAPRMGRLFDGQPSHFLRAAEGVQRLVATVGLRFIQRRESRSLR